MGRSYNAAASSLDRFERQRERVARLVRDLDQAEFNFKPRADQWSVGEIVDHLLIAESLFRDQVQELIDKKRAGHRPIVRVRPGDMDIVLPLIPASVFPLVAVPMSIASSLTPSVFLELFLRYRLVAAPTLPGTTPTPGKPAAQLKRRLKTYLRQTVRLFQKNSDLDFRRMYYQNPLLGIRNVPELVRLLAAHEARHQTQIRKVLRLLPRG